MCPMPGDEVTSSAVPGSRPAHHSGPGYVANPRARDFELDKPLKDAAARWLNLVPAEHRHDGREPAEDVLATLRKHARSCPDHPLGADRLRRRGGAELRLGHLGGAVPDGGC